ncbi:MAG: hypothetical protein HY540_00080 [Deltaproteobacteria bacterium]|nr:hypothetical protein [Deltaproteobacteria bacterium]
MKFGRKTWKKAILVLSSFCVLSLSLPCLCAAAPLNENHHACCHEKQATMGASFTASTVNCSMPHARADLLSPERSFSVPLPHFDFPTTIFASIAPISPQFFPSAAFLDSSGKSQQRTYLTTQVLRI